MRSTSALFALVIVFGGCKGVAPAPAPAPAPEAAPAASAEAAWTHYGAPFSATTKVSAADLLANPAQFEGQTLQITGRVADVCSKAGCWMVISEGDKSIRVLMKDHSFAVDKQGAGSDCTVEGTIEAKAVDPATVQHFAEESRKPEVMPENGVKDGKIYQVQATGVAMRKASAG